jgi:hypothetical protein
MLLSIPSSPAIESHQTLCKHLDVDPCLAISWGPVDHLTVEYCIQNGLKRQGIVRAQKNSDKCNKNLKKKKKMVNAVRSEIDKMLLMQNTQNKKTFERQGAASQHP